MNGLTVLLMLILAGLLGYVCRLFHASWGFAITAPLVYIALVILVVTVPS